MDSFQILKKFETSNKFQNSKKNLKSKQEKGLGKRRRKPPLPSWAQPNSPLSPSLSPAVHLGPNQPT
jgi:transposase